MKVCRALRKWLVAALALGLALPGAAAAPGAGGAPAAMALRRGPVAWQWQDAAGAERLPLVGDDVATPPLDLGFAFPFYGEFHRQVFLSSNGLLTFAAPAPLYYQNAPMPYRGGLGAAIAAFWDDLLLDEASSVLVARGGTAPRRWFAATWLRAGFFALPSARLSFQAVLWEDGRVLLSYGAAESFRPRDWARGTVGLQGTGGRRGLTYRWNGTGGALAPQTTLEFAPDQQPAGPVVSDLQVDFLHAGLYRVSARVTDPAGHAIEAVELTLSGPDYAGQTLAMDAPELAAGLAEVRATSLLDTLGLSEGIFTISVRARNAASTWGEPASTEVAIDRVPPVTTCAFAAPDGADGWYRGAATATCTAADRVSGVDSITYRVDAGAWAMYADQLRVTGEGVHLVEYRAGDRAGNLELPHAVLVAIDGVAPALAFTGLVAGQKLRHSEVLRLTAAAVETGSGLAGLRLELDGNDELANGDVTELWRLDLGEHFVTVTARDRAGNEAELGPVPFTIYADLQSLADLTDKLAGQGYVSAPAVELEALRAALARAEAARAAGSRFGARQEVLAYVERLQQLHASGDVSPAAHAALTADASYVINHLDGDEDCTAC